MDFVALVDQVIALLRQRGRVTYRTLQRQFQLDAGVGQSRLVYEVVHAHHTQGWRVLESASVSYGKATLYFPIVDLLKHYVHIEDAEEPRTVRARVTGQVLTLDETL
jgi:hypothetical protein